MLGGRRDDVKVGGVSLHSRFDFSRREANGREIGPVSCGLVASSAACRLLLIAFV